jgi:hypothetical protein
VTVLLPRRGFSPALGRLLHDRTADTIARIVSRIPQAAATIVPFDTSKPGLTAWLRNKSSGSVVESIEELAEPAPDSALKVRKRAARIISSDLPCDPLDLPLGIDAIGTLGNRQRTTVVGRVRRVRLQPLADSPMLVCEVVDSTGGLELLFYGRRSIPGLVTGAKITATGLTQSHHGTLAIANPRYELHPG